MYVSRKKQESVATLRASQYLSCIPGKYRSKVRGDIEQQRDLH